MGLEGVKMEKEIGKVDDYYSKIGVITLELKGVLSVGDKIRVKGHSTDFIQVVDSIQIEHKPVPSAKAGDMIGIKVNERAKKGDMVLKVTDDEKEMSKM
jgi:translation elongation factor EF-1alpha